ncbi:MAG: amidophosphoribosyltransferase [Atopobium sp.]|uniref:amidophosphoribosyltransferase n=1 Tax=Atopobium sp. TaxID=1872650 RepID=UPI002A762B27|nr:amidophosphoribosyltransferase [Atopobium sp.]MDY2787803.1 amidophosphoribosyltransferase [Atopobium sp.]MDY4522605.1 amidophosphoribosyltransferase [Atopobium sp.]
MHNSQLMAEVDDLCEQDTLHDECGVFGVWAPGRDVARLTYFGTFALQHRGQDSAGIAVGDGQTVLVRKDLGLVNQVFSDTDLAAMPGKVAVGHVRYGTSGAKSWEAAQPHLAVIDTTIIALAHNGTLVNTDSLRQELIKLGVPFRSNTDSEVAAKLVGYYTQQTSHLRQGIAKTMELIEGGYAMALVRENALYAFRDPNGIRPLVIGHLEARDDKPEGWVVASESCALDIVGATYVRDVNPGEIVRFSDDGMVCEQGIAARRPADCVFEHIYFSRPDTRVKGKSIYSMRYNMGCQIARESPVDADIVIGVPDSGMPPAEGFAHQSGIPFGEGLIKNRYVQRTFIQPTQDLRKLGVRLKLNALPDNVAGKRVVMVDDSIVRGTTSMQIVRMLKDAGAKEVHVRINSPEVAWPCFYGIDTAVQEQLISARATTQEICEFIGADSLAFLSVEGMLACVPKGSYCTACFTGEYPVCIPDSFASDKFMESKTPTYLDC